LRGLGLFSVGQEKKRKSPPVRKTYLFCHRGRNREAAGTARVGKADATRRKPFNEKDV
jgi:hypothetical protein